MPTLHEGREKDALNLSTLEDSVRTNPELYLTHHQGAEIDDATFDAELRRRPNPQREEQQRGPQNQYLEPGEANATGTPNNNNNNRSLRTKDTFNENDRKDPPGPTDDNWWPAWMDPLCDIRLYTGEVVNDSRVQNAVLLMIMINAIMMGVATFPFVKEDPDLLGKFEVADQIFLVLFTIESAMQLIYWGWGLLKDGFLVFDLLIVVMSWALEGTQVFRAFRIFRAMRLITRIDTLKNLVLALFSVVPKMTAIFMLLLLIFYIFGVMFTQLFKDMYAKGLVEEPYFSTLYDSLFTLFQMMTLDEWALILYQIQVTHTWAWAPFVVYIIITGFVVVNLIIAVICDAVHVLGNENKAGLHGSDDSEQDFLDNAFYGGDMNNSTNPTEQRLEELQGQLNEMADVQDQMRITIEMLVGQLRENAEREAAAAREAESMSLETNSMEDMPMEQIQMSLETNSMEEMPMEQTQGVRTFEKEAPRARTFEDELRSRTIPIPTKSELSCSTTM